jgi:hypothetical protein
VCRGGVGVGSGIVRQAGSGRRTAGCIDCSSQNRLPTLYQRERAEQSRAAPDDTAEPTRALMHFSLSAQRYKVHASPLVILAQTRFQIIGCI